MGLSIRAGANLLCGACKGKFNAARAENLEQAITHDPNNLQFHARLVDSYNGAGLTQARDDAIFNYLQASERVNGDGSAEHKDIVKFTNDIMAIPNKEECAWCEDDTIKPPKINTP